MSTFEIKIKTWASCVPISLGGLMSECIFVRFILQISHFFSLSHTSWRHCGYILFSVLFQTKSSLVWKSYTQKLRTIFQTNSRLVCKEKNNFTRRRFQTKFRLVWKILMIIVNVLKIPNQIQFGLEQSLTIANALNLEPIPVLFCKVSF